MIYLTALKLAVYPLAALVKIGDTPVDIEEGLHAGVWTVGLARTGNELGLSADEVAALDPADRAARLERARARLGAAGAHYVVDSLADVPALLDDIEARLARGERP
jgi:phosphonoacetaldehyde hydrolase